jgi:hypothetical protein
MAYVLHTHLGITEVKHSLFVITSWWFGFKQAKLVTTDFKHYQYSPLHYRIVIIILEEAHKQKEKNKII